jgi:Mg2+ and Co2+ transporter CorA
MAILCESLDDFVKRAREKGASVSIERVTNLDYPFLDNEEHFTLISIPSYHEQKQNLLFLGAETFAFSKIPFGQFETKFKQLLKKKHGESTAITLVVLRAILKNYSQEFEKIRGALNSLDVNPILDDIEDNGRALRRLTDRLEGLVQIIIELKEKDLEEFNPALVPFEYDSLHTESRYWLERCRSHMYRIASLRTKSEMKANKELNDTMKKLTVITTVLNIAAIVVNVPGTVGAIFGIPALSEAYFSGHTSTLVIVLILMTSLSVVFGFIYWKSLRLK